MCVVSMVMDHYGDNWGKRLPQYVPGQLTSLQPKPPTAEEINEFRELLERAREYDKKNNEPDCEMESKKQKILDLADALGVKIDFL